MVERKCKRCGGKYLLRVPYSRARSDIRDYCPECIKKVQEGKQTAVSE